MDSSDVVAGNNAKATEYNNLRSDVQEHTHDGSDTARAKQNRAFTWFLDGVQILGNELGAKYIVPQDMTVIKIWYKTTAGTATIRIQKNTTTINDGMGATTSVGSDDSITSGALTAGEVITLDLTAVSSGANIAVIMECTQP